MKQWFQIAFFLMMGASHLTAQEEIQECYSQENVCPYCGEIHECETQYEPQTNQRKRFRYSRKAWKPSRFAEEQFQEAGWPGRRGDELSDQLSR